MVVACLCLLVSHYEVVLLAAAPTLDSYAESVFTDTLTLETTGVLSWTNGNVVVCVGATEDSGITLETPSTGGLGLTFAAVTGSPANGASNTNVYQWSGTASATSSGAITSVVSASNRAGIGCFSYSGSDGIGTYAEVEGCTTVTVVSLTRSTANAAVVLVGGDWSAVSDTATDPTPTGTQRQGDDSCFVSTIYNCYINNYGDQGATGTTDYGIAAFAGGGDFTMSALEIKGTGAAAVTPTLSLLGGGPG